MKQIEKNRRERIIELHSKIVSRFKRNLREGIEIGKLLTEQKKSLKHGKWIPWIKANMPFTDQTARNYMELYIRRGLFAKSKTVLDLSQAYRLIENERVFNKAVEDYHIPKSKQRELAEKIKKHKVEAREIPRVVRKAAKKKPVKDPALVRLMKTFDDMDKYATTLKHKIIGFRMQVEDLDITQITGAKSFITLTSLLELRKEIDDLLNIKQTKQIEGRTK